MNSFYVYVHKRKTDSLVFYVGKGQTDRAWATKGRSRYWNNVVNKHGHDVIIVKGDMDECCAHTYEKYLIYKYRSLGKPLVNLTDGGEGNVGWTQSDKTKRLRGLAVSKGKVYSSMGEEFEMAADAARYLQVNGYPKAKGSAIRAAVTGVLKTIYGRSWSSEGFPDAPKYVGSEAVKMSRSKRIRNSNGQEFVVMRDAVRWLRDNGWPRASSGCLSDCANGNRNSAYGYTWEYIDE